VNFDKYVCIGFNGSGDPIGLNIENREIAYLNHDDGFKEVYINGDIEKFARCGIEIIEFQNNLKKFRPESYFSTEFSDEELTQLQNKLTQIHNKIFDNDTHWKHTVEYWIWERQDERNKY